MPKARAEGGELQLQLQRAREVGDDHEQPKTHERIRGRKGPAQLRKEGGGNEPEAVGARQEARGEGGGVAAAVAAAACGRGGGWAREQPQTHERNTRGRKGLARMGMDWVLRPKDQGRGVVAGAVAACSCGYQRALGEMRPTNSCIRTAAIIRTPCHYFIPTHTHTLRPRVIYIYIYSNVILNRTLKTA